MRFALFSDIHSNLEAIEAVLEAFEEEDADRYICLGDIVGYGADPGECINTVKGLNAEIIAGNHDHAAAGKTDIRYFNPYAQAAVVWTSGQLTADEKDFLGRLELVEKFTDFTAVHGTLYEPEKWYYVLSTEDARENFRYLENKILFIGHSHIPVVFKRGIHGKQADGGKVISGHRCISDEKIIIEKDKQYIINIGSVGQPRDGDPRACFALYDDEKNIVQIRRIDYDVSTASSKILDAGLPEMLAYRIERGE